MTFIRGQSCELRVLEGTDAEARAWEQGVMGNLELRHMWTGSLPMRWIDIKAVWENERKARSVEFGIWKRNDKTSCPHAFGLCDSHWCSMDLIGTCGLYSYREVYRSMEFRILLWAEHGHGIGAEATRLVVDYGFKRLNLHRIWLGVHEQNERAIKCYTKVGFITEGRQSDGVFTHGKYHDTIQMRVLEDEWKSFSQAKA